MGYTDGRKQLLRLLDLARTLERSRGMRVAALARLYDVHESRIYNDLKILKKCYVVKKDKGVYRIEGGRPPRWPRIKKDEARHLKLVFDASPLAKEPRFENLLESVLDRLHRPLAKYIEEALKKDAAISIQLKTRNHSDEIEAYFNVLEEALYQQRAVRASYQSGGKTKSVEHVLYPYAIFFRKEDWYLEARSNLSENASLTFKILRFKQVELTDETFELPTDFSLSENLESRWELFSGEPLSVTLKIAAHKAYLVKEKERHRSQEIIERCPDGSVIVRYEVPKEEFTFWVLSLGDAVEVLAPPEFRAEFQEIVHRMHGIYFGGLKGGSGNSEE